MSIRRHTTEEVELSNGAKGLLVHVPEASVMSMLFNFRAGYFLMDDKKWETPHIMEHMSFGANSKFSKGREFQAEYEKNGSFGNAFTSFYDVSYETECADFEWNRILELLILAFSQPKFLKEEFDAECGNVKDELIGTSNNRGRELSIAVSQAQGLRAQYYPDRVENMKHVSLDDIQKHHLSTHTNTNLRFVICGKIGPRRKKILNLLENIPLERGSGRIALPDENPKKVSKTVYVPKNDVANVYVDVSGIAKGEFSQLDWTAAGMISDYLSGTLYSKILGEARERGLVYSLGTGFTQSKNSIYWSLSCQAQQKNLPDLLKIVNREIRKLKNGEISEKDIRALQEYSLGSFQRSTQTVNRLANEMAGVYFFKDIVFDHHSIPERIHAVNKDIIVDVMRRAFSEDNWALGMLGTANEALQNEAREILDPLWQTTAN